jgi:hypothetical protein
VGKKESPHHGGIKREPFYKQRRKEEMDLDSKLQYTCPMNTRKQEN